MKLSTFFIFILIFAFLQSCGTKKAVVKAGGDIENQSLMEFKLNYDSAKTQFSDVQIKGSIDTDIDGKKHNARLNLYVKNTERIWANVSAFAINVARANVTQEGVQMYEILDKTYIDGNFDFFNQALKVDFINYERLQNLLMGQLFLIDSIENYKIEFLDNRYLLSHKQNASYSIGQQGYIHSFSLDSNFRLTQVNILDNQSQTNIQVNYTGWHALNNKNFPGSVMVTIKEGEKSNKVSIEYTDFKLETMDPPFRIPSNYKPREL